MQCSQCAVAYPAAEALLPQVGQGPGRPRITSERQQQIVSNGIVARSGGITQAGVKTVTQHLEHLGR
jgi:hypothetical protein